MSVLDRLDAVVLQFLVECRCWVISGQTVPDQNRPLSVLVQKRTSGFGEQLPYSVIRYSANQG